MLITNTLRECSCSTFRHSHFDRCKAEGSPRKVAERNMAFEWIKKLGSVSDITPFVKRLLCLTYGFSLAVSSSQNKLIAMYGC